MRCRSSAARRRRAAILFIIPRQAIEGTSRLAEVAEPLTDARGKLDLVDDLPDRVVLAEQVENLAVLRLGQVLHDAREQVELLAQLEGVLDGVSRGPVGKAGFP